jgi:hypothetical protein
MNDGHTDRDLTLRTDPGPWSPLTCHPPLPAPMRLEAAAGAITGGPAGAVAASQAARVVGVGDLRDLRRGAAEAHAHLAGLKLVDGALFALPSSHTSAGGAARSRSPVCRRSCSPRRSRRPAATR